MTVLSVIYKVKVNYLIAWFDSAAAADSPVKDEDHVRMKMFGAGGRTSFLPQVVNVI